MRSTYPILTTDAYILHTRVLGEADRTAYVLTKEHGVLFIYAKSIRKEGAKMRGALRPYGRVSLSVVFGKRNILKDIRITDTFSSIWAHETKYTAFVTLLNQVRAFIPVPEAADATTFSIVESTASFLQCRDENLAPTILLVGQVMLASALGYVEDRQIRHGRFATAVKEVLASPARERAYREHLREALYHQ